MMCKICGKEYKQLGNHVRKHNIFLKEYYDKFIKTKDEGLCNYCGQPTKFYNDLSKGYSKYCSNRCSALGEGKGKWMKGRKATPF